MEYMPDVCDLVLDDHETMRRRFAELDERREDKEVAAELWAPLAELLELHAATEEELFYPALLRAGVRAKEETDDAINDHNEIRDAVAKAAGRSPGSKEWWDAVDEAREQNSDHMAEEERGALADMRSNGSADEREALGARWLSFKDEHAGMRGIAAEDKDPEEYVQEHS